MRNDSAENTQDWLSELLAFRDDDISDCPEMTDEQLARMDFAKKTERYRANVVFANVE